MRIAPTGRGLVAEPEGSGDRPRVAFRADIDALRITDAKSVPYRSGHDGVMHACGHDAHATMALAAALALWECRESLPGSDRLAADLPAGRGGQRGRDRDDRGGGGRGCPTRSWRCTSTRS